MKVGSANGRLIANVDGSWFDVERASNGTFDSDPQAIYERWDAFTAWAKTANVQDTTISNPTFDLPVPRPRQIIAIGLNYREHAIESELPIPDNPVVFAKFQSCLVGPDATVTLPSEGIDWEVELVIVIGKEAHNVSKADAWKHVAGLTIGQDLSWREIQLRPPAPQFSVGKSYPGFGPLGPFVVTPDEFANPDDLALSCALNGETLQDSRTRDMIFPVSDLIHRLSQSLVLYPGDVIYTGTPQGVGHGRNPRRYLVPGTLVSSIEGIGELNTVLTYA